MKREKEGKGANVCVKDMFVSAIFYLKITESSSHLPLCFTPNS